MPLYTQSAINYYFLGASPVRYATTSITNYTYDSFYMLGGQVSRYGITGDGTHSIYRSLPSQIGVNNGGMDAFTEIALSQYHGLGIKRDGTLWAWGSNNRGQLGVPTTSIPQPKWKQLNANANFCYALREDGILYGWGVVPSSNGPVPQGNYTGNAFGYYESRIDMPAPIGTSSWSQVFAESDHGFGLRADGTLWGWGTNTYGWLGFGDVTPRSAPAQITTGSTTWKYLKTTSQKTFGIDTLGKLYSWGAQAGFGEMFLGGGTSSIFRSAPVQVLTANSFVFVESDGNGALAATTVGTLWGAGINSSGQLGDGTIITRSVPVQISSTGASWTQLSKGVLHTLGLRADGTLWAWGGNTYGQLGDNTIVSKSSPIQIGSGTNWSVVKAGYYTSFAIDNTGQLFAWGQNTSGWLGTNDIIDRSSPVLVATGVATSPGSISAQASQNNSWANHFIKQDGSLWCLSGSNSYSQLGTGNGSVYPGDNLQYLVSSPVQIYSAYAARPMQVGSSNNWTSVHATNIYAGYCNGMSFAINSSNNLFSWGFNYAGQLGLNDTIQRSVPTQVTALNGLAKKVTGQNFNMVVLANNYKLYGWGANPSGNGANNVYSTPVQLSAGAYANTSFVMVEAGDTTKVAIDSLGKWWAVGTGGYAGLNTDTTVYSFVNIISTSWSSIAAFNGGAIALGVNNTMYGFGLNTILGSTSVKRSAPAQINTSSWTQVYTSYFNAAGKSINGSWYTWGNNSDFGMGNGNDTSTLTPTLLGTTASLGNGYKGQIGAILFKGTLTSPGVSSTVQIMTGVNASASIKNTNNSLYTWGYNTFGQLGDGTNTHKSTAVQVAGSWTSLSLFGTALGIKTDGSLYGWGRNDNAQAALGNYIPRSTPTQVTLATPYVPSGGFNKVTVGLSGAHIIDSKYADIFGVGQGLTVGLGDGVAKSSMVSIGHVPQNDALRFSSISEGTYHVAAISTMGGMYQWGAAFGSGGGGGYGDALARSLPSQIGTNFNWKKVCAANGITIALTTDGAVFTWGNNGVGQLGDNTTVSKSSPVTLAATGPWMDIASHYNGGYAIKTDFTLWAWGQNNTGQLGDGTAINRSSPVQIPGSWVMFSNSNLSHVMAVKVDGTIWAWGDNTQGALGDGTTVNRTSPVQVKYY